MQGTLWVTKLEKENVLSLLLPWSSCSVPALQTHPCPKPCTAAFPAGITPTAPQTNHCTPGLESHPSALKILTSGQFKAPSHLHGIVESSAAQAQKPTQTYKTALGYLLMHHLERFFSNEFCCCERLLPFESRRVL